MLLKDLFENQRPVNPNISYIEDTAERVVAQLKSYNSAEYTRLANRVEEISQLEAEIKQAKEDVKSMAREHVAALFTADDIAKTRVVDTVSFILTLSKDPKPTESYQHAKIIGELTNHLTPELIAILEEIKSRYKTVTPKEPSLKISRKEPEQLDESLAGHFGKLLAVVKRWAAGYDDRLRRLRRMAAAA